MSNPQNLLPPPVKGEVRNPKGRGKGALGTKTIINELLSVIMDNPKIPAEFKEMAEDGKSRYTVKQLILLKQVSKALSGDDKAVSQLLDRLDGKPTQSIEQVNKNLEIKLETNLTDNDYGSGNINNSSDGE